MVKANLKIIIDNEAKQSIRILYNYIKKDSLQNAEKIRSKILVSISQLKKNPEKYPPDKYRFDNDTSYRAYEIYRYRITYHISLSLEEIRIIRIRHSKMNPLEY